MAALGRDALLRLEQMVMAAVRQELDPEAVEFLDRAGPPHIGVAAVAGSSAICVSFYGSETTLVWDGTEADAAEIVL